MYVPDFFVRTGEIFCEHHACICIVALHEGLHWYGGGGGGGGGGDGVSRDFGKPIQGSALSRLASKMTAYNIVESEVCQARSQLQGGCRGCTYTPLWN